jgi:streptogramin lyase
MIGASVQVFAAGTAGNGSTPTPLLSSPLLTDANGNFTVPAFTCPFSNSVLYAVARGGQAGVSRSANTGLSLAAVLGTCASLKTGASITIDEVTTVATAYAMAQFLSGENIGATATNSSGISLAAATAASLASPTTGAAPGTSFAGKGSATAQKINSLADALNTCTTSATSSAACTQLYGAATDGGNAPSDTFGAVLNVVKNPGANIAALYALSQGSGVFGPQLSTAPADWALVVSYGGAGMNQPTSVSIDSTGNVWVGNYAATASLFSNTGNPVFVNGISGNQLEEVYGGAVDVNDVAWFTNEQTASSVNNGGGSITLLNDAGTSPANYVSGGLYFPVAVAFDTSGVAWVANYGSSALTLLQGDGTPLSGLTGYTAKNLMQPVAVATDADCNAYVANQSSNTITLVTADGTTFTDYTVGDGPSGVALDSLGNIWSANYYGDSVGLVTPGTVLSGTGFTSSSLDHPQGIAVDGAGNAWVASYRAPGLTELAAASAATPGAILSPSTGWGSDASMTESFAVAIDASGNVWVTQFGTNTLTEFVGLAVPVQTPLLGPVRVP